MTPRRLEPTGLYEGSIWGELPQSYPTEQAERVYRYLLEILSNQTMPGALMGHGFKGVAYRFRAAVEYATEFSTSYGAIGGTAPPVDEHYRQERALFGFFVSGLSSIESFAFAIHAIAAHYEPTTFGVNQQDLRRIAPEAVAKGLQATWPQALVTDFLCRLVEGDPTYQGWKKIRNVLNHRVVPPRAITASIGSGVESKWRLKSYQFLDADEPLENVTNTRQKWLEDRISELWNGVEQSFPPV